MNPYLFDTGKEKCPTCRDSGMRVLRENRTTAPPNRVILVRHGDCTTCEKWRSFHEDVTAAVQPVTFPVEDPPDRPEFEEWAAERDAFLASQAEDQILREDKEHGC